MAVIRLRWSIAVCVSAAFLLLTNPRIGKRVGNVISCFFLITRDNRHFIFIGIEIAIHCRTGGVTHGDSGFLRFVVVNFIHGVDVDVTGRHYAIAQANAATAVQTILLNVVFQRFRIDITRNVHRSGAILRYQISPGHIEVASGFHIQLAAGIDTRLLRCFRRIVTFRTAAPVDGRVRDDARCRDGDAHRSAPVTAAAFGVLGILHGGDIHIACNVNIRFFCIDVSALHVHITASVHCHRVAVDSTVLIRRRVTRAVFRTAVVID